MIWYRKILPQILAEITGKPRYLPEIKWSDKSWTHNFFRAYEYVFWRKLGIRKEMSTWIENGQQKTECFTLEARIAYIETKIRWAFAFSSMSAWELQRGSIAFGATSEATVATNPSVSHTCTGSDLLVVGLMAGVNDTHSSLDYASVALTRQTSTTFPGAGYGGMSIWSLINPSTGANTLQGTSSASGTGLFGTSFSGCHQTTPIDSTNVNNNAVGTTSLTVSTTVVGTGCWLVGGSTNNDGNTVSGGSGTTVRNWNAFGHAMGDSNGTVSTGSQSLIFTYATSNLFRGIIMSIAPSSGGGGGATVVTPQLLTLGVG